MDDIAEFIRDWDDLDDCIHRTCAADIRQGHLPPSLAISFVGDRPDVVAQMPTFVAEDADEIIGTVIDLFGVLRPDRLAIMWPNRFEDEVTGEVFLAVRVNSACRTGDSTWAWTTRVLGYRHDADNDEIEWADPIELDDPVDPWSRALRTLYEPATHARLQARGWLFVPGEQDGWDCAVHPASRTLDGLQRVAGGRDRSGRSGPRRRPVTGKAPGSASRPGPPPRRRGSAPGRTRRRRHGRARR